MVFFKRLPPAHFKNSWRQVSCRNRTTSILHDLWVNLITPNTLTKTPIHPWITLEPESLTPYWYVLTSSGPGSIHTFQNMMLASHKGNQNPSLLQRNFTRNQTGTSCKPKNISSWIEFFRNVNSLTCRHCANVLKFCF